MHRTAVIFFSLGLLLTACGAAEPELATPLPPTSSPGPTRTPPPSATAPFPATESIQTPVRKGLPLPVNQGKFFSTSGSCTICHTSMKDDSGADVSIDDSWRSTMMANAARDPYWQASVRREVETFPQLSETIQDKCATCHMPMAQFTSSVDGEAGMLFGQNGFLAPDHPLNSLALDGVSCTVCHQIRADNLGTATSFSGGFQIDTTLESPERLLFGPYQTTDRDIRLMQVSGFTPIQGLHMTESELCATCHTLYTPYVDTGGQVAGEFPEQVTYLEWYYSDFRSFKSCQDCHMPEASGGVRISTTSERLRSPFAKHSFVGGNAYMLEILDRHGDELGVTASSEQFQATIERTLDQLQDDTVSLTLEGARISGNRIVLDLKIESLPGHKFPTGFPSRRAWLHVLVKDANGVPVFESGAVSPDGSIQGNDNDVDPGTYEQHYEAIVQEDQVQIYEAILRDSERAVTTTLLRAAGYLKDNRLLPAGFDKSLPHEDIAVRGLAFGDLDFDEGMDEIQYVIALGESQGPYHVLIEMRYQSIGYRWIENLGDQDGAEIERFLAYAGASANEGILLSSVEIDLGG